LGQFVVDQIDIINDSMGAMSDTPQKFGLAAARLRPDLVYSILLANANLDATARALFNSTDGNTASGALASGALESAISSMKKQRENSVNLNVTPTHLIVLKMSSALTRGLYATTFSDTGRREQSL
jgi:phage major head subunit gpT-like protein